MYDIYIKLKFYPFFNYYQSKFTIYNLNSSQYHQIEPNEDEYYQYYSDIEESRKMFDSEVYKKEASEESTITLWKVLEPFFYSFLGTIVVMVVCLLSFVCVCLWASFDWSRMFNLIEYCPCISHAKLKARFELLKYPGLYHNQRGRIEYYKASDAETDLIQDIETRLQS